jgi:hypothetical protein
MHVAEFSSRQLIGGKVSDRRVIKARLSPYEYPLLFFFYLYKRAQAYA